jgi:hypothetical protein
MMVYLMRCFLGQIKETIIEDAKGRTHLYYWFSVGEATLPLHHLTSDFALTQDTKLPTNAIQLVYLMFGKIPGVYFHAVIRDYRACSTLAPPPSPSSSTPRLLFA